jgi:hypothetical protein
LFSLALAVTVMGCREKRTPDRDHDCRGLHTPPYAYLPDDWTMHKRYPELWKRGCVLASDGVLSDDLLCCPFPSN